MSIHTTDPNELVASIEDAVSQITGLMRSVEESQVNTVPYEGSWTAPQLLRHVTKSIAGMAKAMQMEAKPADRDPAARVEELKAAFLDFSKKLQSPEFIVPEEKIYEKQAAIEELRSALEQFRANAKNARLDELVEGLPLGPITKLELIHFTLFHTTRHLHQMEKICAALEKIVERS